MLDRIRVHKEIRSGWLEFEDSYKMCAYQTLCEIFNKELRRHCGYWLRLPGPSVVSVTA